jgi:hypothetical protein
LLEHLRVSWWFKYYWSFPSCSTWGHLGTTCRSLQDYSSTSHLTTKYSGACRTDIHGTTTEVDHAHIQDWLLGLPWHVSHGARWCGLQGNTD